MPTRASPTTTDGLTSARAPAEKDRWRWVVGGRGGGVVMAPVTLGCGDGMDITGGSSPVLGAGAAAALVGDGADMDTGTVGGTTGGADVVCTTGTVGGRRSTSPLAPLFAPASTPPPRSLPRSPLRDRDRARAAEEEKEEGEEEEPVGPTWLCRWRGALRDTAAAHDLTGPIASLLWLLPSPLALALACAWAWACAWALACAAEVTAAAATDTDTETEPGEPDPEVAGEAA